MNDKRNVGVILQNSSIENVKEFKYLGTILTDQNYIQKELKAK
jgi:hypothetical protein